MMVGTTMVVIMVAGMLVAALIKFKPEVSIPPGHRRVGDCYPFATQRVWPGEKPRDVEALNSSIRGLKIPVSLVRFRVQALLHHEPTPAHQDANPDGPLASWRGGER
jgi:hypothetical protein